jgi:hypothetical protein
MLWFVFIPGVIGWHSPGLTLQTDRWLHVEQDVRFPERSYT